MIADESLIERIIGFLIDHPGSTALQIASALNTSRQRVSSAILQNNVISPRDVYEKPARFVLSVPVSDDTPIHAQSTHSEPITLDHAVGALFEPLANRIRCRIEQDLSRILHDEIAKAIDTIGQNTLSRLCDHLCFDDVGSATNKQSDKPAPLSGIQCPNEPTARHDGPSRPSPTKNGQPKESAEHPTFTNPVGAPFVPQDTVSKRTAHKAPAAESEQQPSTKPPFRRAKMVVIGLKPAQQELIKREFKEKFDLRMFTADQQTFIKKAINAGDNVIGMADFLSHSHTDIIQARNGNLTIVHGGLHSLRDELTEFLEKQEAQAA